MEAQPVAEAPPPAALVTMDPAQYVAAVYRPLTARIETALAECAAFDYDVRTTAGMKVAVQRRAALRGVRTSIEAERKERKAPILEIGRLLDQRAKELTARIEPLEDQHDAQIKAEEARKEAERAEREAAERARMEALLARVNAIREPLAAVARSPLMASSDIKALLADVVDIAIDDSFAEYTEQASIAKAQTMDALSAAIVAAELREAEAARLAFERAAIERERQALAESLRQAEAERAAREAAAQAARDAEQAAQAAEQAEERARLDAERAQLDAERAELRRQQQEREQQQRAEREAREQREREAAAAEALRRNEDEQRKRRAVATRYIETLANIEAVPKSDIVCDLHELADVFASMVNDLLFKPEIAA